MTMRSVFAGMLMTGVLMISGVTKAQSGDNENRAVKVINRASSPIYHLYVSNVDNHHWGPDQLGIFDVILTGYYESFNMDDGSGHCLFDIKVVLKDGRTAETDGLNVCTKSSWTVFN